MLIKDFIALSKEEREQIAIPLDFSNQEIGMMRGEYLNAFCEALGQCREVPEIDLSHNTLYGESLRALKDALGKCKNLSALILRNDHFHHTAHAKELGMLISQCSALESLDLSGAELGENLTHAMECCPKLKVLILRKNWGLPWSPPLPRSLGSLLSKACPQLQILDISENIKLEDHAYEILQLIDRNRNLHEIQSSEPLTPIQSSRLKSRFIQYAIKRVEEIVTETDIPVELALLTLQYDDDTLSRHVDEKTASLIREGLVKLLTLKHALAMKKRWDVAKLFSLTIVSFVLPLTFAAYLFSGIALIMSTCTAAMISTMVFKTCKNYVDKRNNDLLATLTLDPSILEDDVIERVRLEKAFNEGKQSVKSWVPYLRYYSEERNETYRQYWNKGQVEGLIGAYAPAKIRAAT